MGEVGKMWSSGLMGGIIVTEKTNHVRNASASDPDPDPDPDLDYL